MSKKDIRKNFRRVCLDRDKYQCITCSFQSTQDKAEIDLDVHHITDRKQIINGGYCLENGISLCHDCHLKAEGFHSTGINYTGFSPDDLYVKINSSYEKAVAASKKLKN